MQRKIRDDASRVGPVPPRLARFVSTTIALAAIAASPAAFPVAAAAAPPITVQPLESTAPVSFFSLRGKPGETLRGNEIVVRNTRQRPVRLSVEPVDAETAENLGFAYEVGGLESEGSTKWISAGDRKVGVPPGGAASVPVTVRVPRDAAPGDYLSGVSILPRGQTTEAQPREGVSVASEHRFSIGVLVKVPGPRTARIDLTGASVSREPAGVTFFVDASNPGNVLLRDVTGKILVTRDGKRVASTRLGPGTFVAGTSFSQPLLAAKEEPSEGTEYRVQGELRYGGRVARFDEIVTFGREAAERQEDFGGPAVDDGLPLWLLLLVAAGLILLAAILLWIRHRRQRWAPLGPQEALPRLDTEVEAAQAAGQPVSIIRMSPEPPNDALLWTMLVEIMPRLRPRDSVCNLGNGEVMIIAPNTGGMGAAGLADELREVLARSEQLSGAAVKVRTASSEGNLPSRDLLASAS